MQAAQAHCHPNCRQHCLNTAAAAAAAGARRAVKIVATLGPATWTPEGMSQLLAAGVDVVRFNVKHQTQAENQALLDMWRVRMRQQQGSQASAQRAPANACARSPACRGRELAPRAGR